MAVFHNEGRWDTSNVEFSGGRILAYDKRVKTPRMQFIDYGLGVFHQDAFTGIPAEGSYDLAQLYQDLLSRGELAACEIKQRFYEIGSVEGLNELSQYLASGAKTSS
jgi:NDP-sugar pyrophosphorylase family protein